MYKHQTIEYDKRLPAKTSLCDSAVNRCRGEPHWHEEIQLIYVDEGSLNMTVGNSHQSLRGTFSEKEQRQIFQRALLTGFCTIVFRFGGKLRLRFGGRLAGTARDGLFNAKAVGGRAEHL